MKTKYILEKKGYGKFIYYRIKSVSGKKLESLERKRETLYDSYSEANERKKEMEKKE